MKSNIFKPNFNSIASVTEKHTVLLYSITIIILFILLMIEYIYFGILINNVLFTLLPLLSLSSFGLLLSSFKIGYPVNKIYTKHFINKRSAGFNRTRDVYNLQHLIHRLKLIIKFFVYALVVFVYIACSFVVYTHNASTIWYINTILGSLSFFLLMYIITINNNTRISLLQVLSYYLNNKVQVLLGWILFIVIYSIINLLFTLSIEIDIDDKLVCFITLFYARLSCIFPCLYTFYLLNQVFNVKKITFSVE